jgi:hypothetical protein
MEAGSKDMSKRIEGIADQNSGEGNVRELA